MIQTVTVDIIDDKALKLLQDLELLQLIRVRKGETKANVNWEKKYKGAMTKQPITEINDQLSDLRSEWV